MWLNNLQSEDKGFLRVGACRCRGGCGVLETGPAREASLVGGLAEDKQQVWPVPTNLPGSCLLGWNIPVTIFLSTRV